MPENAPAPMMIMHDLEGLPVGAQMPKWPAHITVVPFFTAGTGREMEIVNLVGTVGREVGSFLLRPGEAARYGPNGDTLVTKIDDLEGGLQRLHGKLISDLGKAGCKFADLRYALESYAPHSSYTGRNALPPGIFVCNEVSVVQKLPMTATPANKLLLGRVRLGEA